MEVEIVIESDSEDESGDEIDNEEVFEEPDIFGVRHKKGMKLFDYQIDAIKWMMFREENVKYNIVGGIFAFFMGMGKTVSLTELCMSEKYIPIKDYSSLPPSSGTKIHNFPSLVICSKTIVYEWKSDIEKFFGKSCPFIFFHKNNLKKFDLITFDTIKEYKIIITTYDTIVSVVKKHKLANKQIIWDNLNRRAGINSAKRPSLLELKEARGGLLLFKIPFHRIICDESQRMVNPRSSTFYAMMCLYGERKWCLSGTPLRNYTSDLYSQLRFCGYDKIKNTSHFNYDVYNRHKLFEFILCRNYEDVGIKLPNVVEETLFVTLKGKEKEIYDYYHNATKKAYNGFLLGTHTFSCVLTLFLRLRQICLSAYTILAESSRDYNEFKEKEKTNISQYVLDRMPTELSTWVRDKNGTAGVDSAKATLVMDIISKIKGEKVLVFTSFKKVIDILVLAMKKKMPNRKYLILDGDVVGQHRDDTLDKFKTDMEIEVLFMSYKVGSEGLNLTIANNIITCENWWTPVVHQQAVSRSHRTGQDKEVRVWNIIIKNSIEEKIEGICQEKLKLIDNFLTSKKKFSTKIDAYTIGKIIK